MNRQYNRNRRTYPGKVLVVIAVLCAVISGIATGLIMNAVDEDTQSSNSVGLVTTVSSDFLYVGDVPEGVDDNSWGELAQAAQTSDLSFIGVSYDDGTFGMDFTPIVKTSRGLEPCVAPEQPDESWKEFTAYLDDQNILWTIQWPSISPDKMMLMTQTVSTLLPAETINDSVVQAGNMFQWVADHPLTCIN